MNKSTYKRTGPLSEMHVESIECYATQGGYRFHWIWTYGPKGTICVIGAVKGLRLFEYKTLIFEKDAEIPIHDLLIDYCRVVGIKI